MNSIKAFFREKGRYLFCLALVFAATVAGVLALGNIVRGFQRTAPEEDTAWTEPDTTVNNPTLDIPKPTAPAVQTGSAAGSAASSSSAAPSASGGGSADAAGSAASQEPRATLPASPWAADPVEGFSGQDLVYQKTLGDWRTHNGADYAAEPGTDVPPAVPGTVLTVYQDALWGGVVEVAGQDGTLWRYCGLEQIAVKQDDKVNAATVLGKVGNIPAEQRSPAHLHLECSRDAAYLDPQTQK